MLASHQGNVEVVSKLLTLDGIEINHIDEDGDSGNAIIIIISIIINTVITYPNAIDSFDLSLSTRP